MRAALLPALLVLGCRIDLDTQDIPRVCRTYDPELGQTPPAVCAEADDHDDFAWIQDNIFSTNCSGDSCHGDPGNGQPPSGQLLLSAGRAYETLMGVGGNGVMSQIAEGRPLVVPGDPDASYLFFLVRGVPAKDGDPPFEEPPDAIGYMPMANDPLCCQKVDAIGRWIRAGAMP